jgi:hypothetical protein
MLLDAADGPTVFNIPNTTHVSIPLQRIGIAGDAIK